MVKQLVLECSNISFSYSGISILEHIDLKLYKSTITTLIGPNGGGKTTLGRIVAGSLKPISGNVYRKKNLTIGYMPQKISLNKLMPLTAKQFLLLSLNRKVSLDEFNEVVSQQNIIKLLNKQIYDLSGGELQRILFSRLLISNPDILILDEPTEGLDVLGEQEFYSSIERLCSEQKKTILLISHDLHVVMSSSNHVLCLDKVIRCSGLPEAVSKHKHYKSMFYKKQKDLVSYYEHDHRG